MTHTLKSPMTSAEIPDSWIEAFRDAASRAERGPNVAASYRAGLHAATIEAHSPTRGWLATMLPSGSNLFATAEDRDAVLARIRV